MQIEPKPHDDLKRVIFDSHPWPLAEGSTPYHEAGHLIAGLALGMPCHNARISPDGTAGRAGVLNPVGENSITTPPPSPDEVAGIYLQCACVIWPGLPAAEAALNYAVMLVAGRQAELINAGIRLGGELHCHDPDHQQSRAILAATGQRLAMTWAQRNARHILTAKWPEVVAIAAELRETGTWTNTVAWVRQSRIPATTGY
ncbi:MAG: hypothetical protein QG662_1941 [Pseudomonadota bacterium]|nr:hypothetical protein [Pseudomonadota bacterium]